MTKQLSDIEISRLAKLGDINDIARKLDIDDTYFYPYGKDKGKIDLKILNEVENKTDGRLILVTAISPTKMGEGKTTTTIGLADALNSLGKKTVCTLREPSMGPVFGLKGGATGGGYAQIAPMEDINLHFTGDFHAISSANNLIAAMLDNHIYQGNELNIDPTKIAFKRCMDMNDRQLRHIVCGLGSANGVPREDGFDITVASEIMATFCLASSLTDLKDRIGRIVVAYTYSGEMVTVSDLNVQGAVTALLKDAFKPNLVQTLEQTPAIVHGGPFANIAHGCNSAIATKLSLKLADYVVTEAGFGADLGAEKFIDIKCQATGLKPSCAVIVVTVKALKYHGGMDINKITEFDLDSIKRGLSNLIRHVENMRNVFNVPCVVAINQFSSDRQEELDFVLNFCNDLRIPAHINTSWKDGSEGAVSLAKEVITIAENSSLDVRYAYTKDMSIKEKIEAVATKVYHADSVIYSKKALKKLDIIEREGLNELFVCIAKTPYSFSDDQTKIGACTDFDIHVNDIKINLGSGFIVAITGNTLTMPGLPKVPAANSIDVLDDGNIVGLF